MCEYYFRRHDQHRLANATRTKWYNMDREANHYTQQHINFNRSMPIASSMGMRMGGGRR
ncbi:hypothetical protein [Francisella halioticida]|uniref:hypothetical protein n=1 Tax=Francisella halioticida TaxID=549298 RepID=UPI0012FA20E3|nr:hypothetical protein [Francisella halioticida]